MNNQKRGGARPGAGRKPDFIANFSVEGDRKPRSIYCDGVEIKQVKIFLYRKRAIKILQNYEPVAGNANHYKGTHEEWERDYNSIRMLDLENIHAMQGRIDEIIKKCEGAKD